MDAPTHYYRYQTCEHLDRLRTILLQHELYFPTAAELNDPADCRPRIATTEPRKLARFFMRAWAANHPEASLRDRATEWRYIVEGIERFGYATIHERVTKYFHDSSAKARVFSMSKRWNNMSLWAKYAANHTGYCLEFANREIFSIAREVKYGNDVELDVTADTAATDTLLLFFCKTGDWSNEEEVRLIGPTFIQPVIRLEPSLLPRIILGKDMKVEHWRQIHEWAKTREPPLLLAQARYDAINQRLVADPVDTSATSPEAGQVATT